MREFELRLPVCNWLLSRGLKPVVEVGSLRNCDVVGLEIAAKPLRIVRMVAVELKLADVTGVLRQCSRHVAGKVNEVWAAMPADVTERHKLRFAGAGVGLLAVADGSAAVVVAPAVVGEGPQHWNRFRGLIRRRDEYLWRMKNPMMLRDVDAVAEAAR